MSDIINDSKKQEEQENTERYIRFSLGEEEYAIPLLKVREVIAMPDVTPVPQTPTYFLGIMNLRGQVISVLDMRLKLGIKTQESPEMAVIIADLGKMCVGIVVDAINSVLSPSPEDISPKPDLQKNKASEYITGVYRKEKGLILFLDINRLLSFEDHNSIAAATQRKAA
jgi:purine-binding chemotaxis protein CheW